MASNYRFEIAFERYHNDIEDYVTDPYPILFGTRDMDLWRLVFFLEDDSRFFLHTESPLSDPFL